MLNTSVFACNAYLVLFTLCFYAEYILNSGDYDI